MKKMIGESTPSRLEPVMQVSILPVTPPPRLTPRPLIFSVKIPAPRTAFQCKTPAPGSKKGNKIPILAHNLHGLNDKISMKKEHNSIRAVYFQRTC